MEYMFVQKKRDRRYILSVFPSLRLKSQVNEKPREDGLKKLNSPK